MLKSLSGVAHMDIDVTPEMREETRAAAAERAQTVMSTNEWSRYRSGFARAGRDTFDIDMQMIAGNPEIFVSEGKSDMPKADTDDHILASMDLVGDAGRKFEDSCWDDRLNGGYAALVDHAQHHLERAMEALEAGLSPDSQCREALTLAEQLRRRATEGGLAPSEILVIESHLGSVMTLLASIITTQSDEELERIFASPKVSAELDALIPH